MRRKLRNEILTIILIVVIFIGMFPPIEVQATVQSDDDLGDGALTGGPIEINSQLELAQMQNSDEHFILTKDIEISGNWNPISDFKGILDGSGHSITYNIQENTGPFPTTQYLGLFASCSEANIKNLYVNGNISLTTGSSMSNPNIYVGGIVATSENSILENVHFSGNINIVTSNDNSSWVGGLAGKTINTAILLSHNTASITSEVESIIGSTRTGGLCGEFDGEIEDCYNTGNIIAIAANGSPYAGGLVANNKGTITQSYNSGKVQSIGTLMSLSDVYAGGIAALGESESSITKCAVMSPEISVTAGWVNSGYKYIIAKGGSKSDNISINSITGSPTNDSNARYTQAELKTTTPYDLSFYNTWAINENINNGYPYHDRNVYASKYMTYTLVPQGLKSFVDNNYINVKDLMQTDDGFTLCTKSLDKILNSMGIGKIESDVDFDEEGNPKSLSPSDFDDWYIFNIGTSYSILKMRNGIGKEKGGDDPGTAIPFMELNLELLNLYHGELVQQVENSEYEAQLYNALNNVTIGKVDSNYTYSHTIADYFSKTSSKANHLISEEYIKKVLSTDRDSDGYIIVPTGISSEQKNFLLTLPNIYDEENERIQVNKYNLTNDEKHAILACRTGNKSFNNYAAENIAHAICTKLTADFLQGTDDMLEVDKTQIPRAVAAVWLDSAIKADAGIGEESFPKDFFPLTEIETSLKPIFGDI